MPNTKRTRKKQSRAKKKLRASSNNQGSQKKAVEHASEAPKRDQNIDRRPANRLSRLLLAGILSAAIGIYIGFFCYQPVRSCPRGHMGDIGRRKHLGHFLRQFLVQPLAATPLMAKNQPITSCRLTQAFSQPLPSQQILIFIRKNQRSISNFSCKITGYGVYLVCKHPG